MREDAVTPPPARHRSAAQRFKRVIELDVEPPQAMTAADAVFPASNATGDAQEIRSRTSMAVVPPFESLVAARNRDDPVPATTECIT